jgi:hypothetical protein
MVALKAARSSGAQKAAPVVDQTAARLAARMVALKAAQKTAQWLAG